MTEIEELIQAAEQVLAKLESSATADVSAIAEPVRPLYIDGYIDGVYIEALYMVALW